MNSPKKYRLDFTEAQMRAVMDKLEGNHLDAKAYQSLAIVKASLDWALKLNCKKSGVSSPAPDQGGASVTALADRRPPESSEEPA